MSSLGGDYDFYFGRSDSLHVIWPAAGQIVIVHKNL